LKIFRLFVAPEPPTLIKVPLMLALNARLSLYPHDDGIGARDGGIRTLEGEIRTFGFGVGACDGEIKRLKMVSERLKMNSERSVMALDQ
jgi:hypothetical protein